MKNILLAIFVVCLIGLGISSFLTYEYTLLSPINCPIGGTGCDAVRQSIYSNILGISVPWLGIAYYIGMLVLTLVVIEKESKISRNLLWLGGLTGLLFSLYFSFLEAFVIHAWCFWCVLSAICTLVIFVLTTRVLALTRQIDV